jgi:hypothetical protein
MVKISANDGWLPTRYIVGTHGAGVYTTIQSAINDAIAANKTAIYIQPGVYIENLDFSSVAQSMFIYGGCGNAMFSNEAGVAISGTHNISTNANLVFQNISFADNTDIFNTTSASGSTLDFSDCSFSTNAAGTSLNLPNWTGAVNIQNCFFTSATDSCINCTAASRINLMNVITSDATDQMILGTNTGVVQILELQAAGPVSVSASFASIEGSVFLGGTLTCNTSTGYLDSCQLAAGSTTPSIALTGGELVITNTYAWTVGGNPVITFSGGALANASGLFCVDSTMGTESITQLGSTVFNSDIHLPSGGTLGLVEIDGTAANGAACGLATLSSGTVTIANTFLSSSSRVLVTRSSINGSTGLGFLEAVPSSGSLTITSYTGAAGTQALDNSIVFWMAIEGL